MTKEQAIESAKAVAIEYNCIIAVYSDPYSEYPEDGIYSFCPEKSYNKINIHFKLEALTHPNGDIEIKNG